MKSKVIDPSAPALRVIKSAMCTSLNGKSQHTYNISIDPHGEIFLYITQSSGGGYWSREPVPMSAIQKLLADVPSDQSITSFLLHPLFSGKSQNNSGFMWAVLKAEGLVELVTDNPRVYRLTDGKAFFDGVQALIASVVGLGAGDQGMAEAVTEKATKKERTGRKLKATGKFGAEATPEAISEDS